MAFVTHGWIELGFIPPGIKLAIMASSDSSGQLDGFG